MDDTLRAGINFFNAGLYYAAHESWEDLWRRAEEPDRRFCQGLVQVAVGLHHLQNGNRSGGTRVLHRGMTNLQSYPDHFMGIDKASLVEDIRAVLEDADAVPPLHIRWDV